MKGSKIHKAAMSEKSEFDKALHNFTMDMACGDAIRALTDRGYGPLQIKEVLTFPAPLSHITKVMWDRLVASGKIMLTDPATVSDNAHPAGDGFTAAGDHEIVERRDRYGRRSFLRIKKETSEENIFSPEEYFLVDKDLSQRDEYKDNDLISHLPWPKEPVWVHRSLLDRR